MNTRTYKTKKPSKELMEYLYSHYKNDDKNNYSFIDFYWYWSSNHTKKVYGCLVINNGRLWENPQI